MLKTAGSGDSKDLFPADHSRGGFTISGENDAAISYSAAITGNFGTDLSLSNVQLNPSAAGNLNSSGDLVLGVGATVGISAGATGGHTGEITLTANYQ